MYPNLYYLVDDLFGIKLNGLKLINSFGFFVAIAFVASDRCIGCCGSLEWFQSLAAKPIGPGRRHVRRSGESR